MSNSYQDQFEKIWKTLEEVSESARAGAEERREFAEERREYDKESRERKRVLDEELAQIRKEADEAYRRTEAQIQETAEAVAETQKTVKELSSQYGEIGNRTGAIVESVTAPSVRHILESHFKVVEFFPERKRALGGENFETDLIGLAGDHLRRAYIVEIKTKFGERGREQVQRNLERFFLFYPEFEHLELYGMMVSPRMTENDFRWAFRNGIYSLEVADDLYRLKAQEGFEARNYGNNSALSPPAVRRALPGKWTEYH